MSDSEGDKDDYVMYKDRKEWKDVIPIPQDDGEHPVVKIAYSEEFEDVYDYFRGIVAKGELSERALYLTHNAIQLNAANYTVWQYRRKIIKHINYDLRKELEFCREMIELNPKNYQVWHHRRVIVGWLGDASKELRLTQIIFSFDAKNYHAWEHRQWVLSTFKLFDGEMEYVDDLLRSDVRNNSAWNQRYFCIVRTTGFTTEAVQQEMDYAMAAIDNLPNNECPWNYLKGVLDQSSKPLSAHPEVESWAWRLLSNVESRASACVAAFLVDVLEDRLQQESTVDRSHDLQRALTLCNKLASETDKIRHEYWRYIGRRINSRHKV